MQFWRKYWALVAPFKVHVAISVALVFAFQLVDVANTFVLKAMFDLLGSILSGKSEFVRPLSWIVEALGEYSDSMVVLIASVLAVYLFVDVLKAYVRMWSERASELVSLSMDESLNVQAHNKLMTLSLGYHIREQTGKKLGKIGRGVEAIVRTTNNLFFRIVPPVLKSVVYFVALVAISPKAGILIAVIIPISLINVLRADKKYSRMQKDRADAGERSDMLAQESIVNIATVQTFGQAHREHVRFAKWNKISVEKNWNETKGRLFAGFTQNAFTSLGFIAIMGLFFYEFSHSSLTLGDVFIYIQFIMGIMGSVNEATNGWLSVGRKKEDAQRFFTLLDQRSEIQPPENPLPVGSLRGAVTYEGVSFSYPGGSDALRNFNLEVPPGKMVAIVGYTGSGKST
ncbi:MAG: ABC transporter ATP-binding protein, partial [Patescibacteria group bacterium]